MSPLSARATLWEAQQQPGWTQYPSLPVVDRQNTVLGALTHSALRAGTARAADRADHQLRFSILTHMGEAFIVVVGGLLATLAGLRTGHEPRLHTPATDAHDTGRTRHDA